MTYTIYDKSTEGGSPYELFAFLCATGDYYYTTNGDAVTWNAHEYQPLQIKRGTLELNAVTDSVVTTEITLPVDCKLFQDHGRGVVHPDMTVEIRRAHRGTSGLRLRGVGRVVGHKVADHIYTLTVKNTIQTEVQRSTAPVYYQNRCNHEFGDTRCGAAPADFAKPSNVVALSDYSVQVINDGFADHALIGGRLTIGAEIRTILDNVANVITLAYPFVLAKAGDPVTLTRWCDLSYTQCGGVFGNTDRFGGFPTLPEVSPAAPDFEVINTRDTVSKKKARARNPFAFSGSVISG